MIPARTAVGHRRGISRCPIRLTLIRLTPRTGVIDRSETVLPGSSPAAEAESAAETVAEEPAIAPSWPAQSTVSSSRADRIIWGTGEGRGRHWLLALLIAGGLWLRGGAQFPHD